MSMQEVPIPRVCTQCGAPLDGNHCKYCGTKFSFPLNNYKGPDEYALGKNIISYAAYDILGNKLWEVDNQL